MERTELIVRNYLNNLNDGVNFYLFKTSKELGKDDTYFEIGPYIVENRELGFFIKGNFPILDENNLVGLELSNFMGRNISQDYIKEVFNQRCDFISKYSSNAHFDLFTLTELEDFFLHLDANMKKIKDEFPFTPDMVN